MSRPVGKSGAAGGEQALELTQTLRRLDIREVLDAESNELPENRATALLVCRDPDIGKWGRRWLEREQLDVAIAESLDDGLRVARTLEPDVILVESGLQGENREPAIRALAQAQDVRAPIIALCTSNRDIGEILEIGVDDIARKPFEWKLIGRRARAAARAAAASRELDDARRSLAEALDVAKGAHRRLRSHESFEPVTGLPNKKKFLQLLSRGMGAVDRDRTVLAVFVIGFSRFRLVIEAMGQESVDRVLAKIGARLTASLDTVHGFQTMQKGLKTSVAANIDSARFALMMTCRGDEDELAVLQQNLIEQFSRPVQVSGQTVHLSACVGVALYPQDASDADSLLQRADNAMRDAQSRGGGYKFYCAEMDAAAARKLRLEHMLHEALNAGELQLAYQPIVAGSDGRLAGVEALLRWTLNDGTEVGPAEFVPVAEESGLMARIGAFVLDEACGRLRDWLDRGFRIPRISVNVSLRQLMHGGFTQTVREALDRHALEPSRLELELSERGVLSGDADVVQQLKDLKSLGVRLSIDDFGTGDSAIAYLRDLPVDVLKIDRSYIRNLPANAKDAAMVTAMIALGHGLELVVVAEGIEDEAQRDMLVRLGCDHLQGYLFARPQSEDSFLANLPDLA